MPKSPYPALLTTTSSEPSFLCASATALNAAARFVTSRAIGTTRVAVLLLQIAERAHVACRRGDAVPALEGGDGPLSPEAA
jgi:hypothetical protein